MRPTLRLSLCLFVFLFVPPCPDPLPAAVDGSRFRYESRLETLQAGQLYGLQLTADVLRRCQGDLRDLRLLNAEGQEVPYLLVEEKTAGDPSQPVPLALRRFESGSQSVCLELEIPAAARPLRSLRVETPDHNFRRLCQIEADAGSGFQFITRGEIFDFSRQVDLRQLEISLPTVEAQRLRLTLLPDENLPWAGQEAFRLHYKDLDFQLDAAGSAPLRIDALLGIPSRQRLPREERDRLHLPISGPSREGPHSHRWQMECGLPFDRIHFRIATPAFHRKISVYGTKDPQSGERSRLASTSIYRLPFGNPPASKLEMASDSVSWPWLILISEDGDDSPLQLEAVELSWVRRRLLFHAPDSPVTLVAGAAGMRAPRYDLALLINPRKWQELPWQPLIPPPMTEAAGFRPPTPTSDGQREKQWLTLVILFMVTVLGVVFCRVLKEEPAKPGREPGPDASGTEKKD